VRDPLREVLARADALDPVFAADELTGWLAGAVERYARVGVLAECGPARFFACDSCGHDHVEEVVWVHAAGRPLRGRAWFRRSAGGFGVVMA
jgi:hypothetical protein